MGFLMSTMFLDESQSVGLVTNLRPVYEMSCRTLSGSLVDGGQRARLLWKWICFAHLDKMDIRKRFAE